MEQLALKDIFARMLRQKEENPQKPAAATDAAILIVDDSRTILHAFKTMLEGAGYQTLSGSWCLATCTACTPSSADRVW